MQSGVDLGYVSTNQGEKGRLGEGRFKGQRPCGGYHLTSKAHGGLDLDDLLLGTKYEPALHDEDILIDFQSFYSSAILQHVARALISNPVLHSHC